MFKQFENLNFEHFRQRRQFQTDSDKLKLEPEYSDPQNKNLKKFYDLPDISPLVVNPENDGESNLLNAMKGVNWDTVTEEQKAAVL